MTSNIRYPIPDHIQEAIDAGSNLMIHGRAGTGKSTILQAICRYKRNTIVLAPTGVAALNVNGVTIHSFFGFNLGYLNPQQATYCERRASVLLRYPTIIIDEISMVRSDVFDTINVTLQKTMRNKVPFGGLQIILMGDTGQLPPIVKGEESQFFANGSEMFFNSDSFSTGKFSIIELNTVYRQSDVKYIDFLSNVRSGIVNDRELTFFNRNNLTCLACSH